MIATDLDEEIEALEAEYQEVLSLRLLMEKALLKYQQTIRSIQVSSEKELADYEKQFEQSVELYKKQLHEIEINDLVQHIKTLD